MENVSKKAAAGIKPLKKEKDPITPQKLIRFMSKKYGVTVEEILGRSRKPFIVEARQRSAFLIRNYFKHARLDEKGEPETYGNGKVDWIYEYTLQEIAGILNLTNHATICHAINAIKYRKINNQLLIN